MYLAAPFNRIYHSRITVSDGSAELEIDINETLFHAARAVHSFVCFKMLDGAAFLLQIP